MKGNYYDMKGVWSKDLRNKARDSVELKYSRRLSSAGQGIKSRPCHWGSTSLMESAHVRVPRICKSNPIALHLVASED